MTTTPAHPARQQDVQRLAELIQGIRFAMLTTEALDGSLRSRPMATQQVEFDGDLWFFAGRDSDKVAEIGRTPAVNVSFADSDANRYVSVAGTARLTESRAKALATGKPYEGGENRELDLRR